MLRRHYAIHLRKNYAKITHQLANHLHKIRRYSQIRLRSNYAIIIHLSFTQLYYAEIMHNKLRNHFAYYAIITQMNYAEIREKITQIITQTTQSLRNSIISM